MNRILRFFMKENMPPAIDLPCKIKYKGGGEGEAEPWFFIGLFVALAIIFGLFMWSVAK